MKNKKKKSSVDYLIYVLIALIILVGIYMYISYRNEQIMINTYNIVLKGDSNMEIYEGMPYQEPGYYAYNYENIDCANLVKVEGSVNSNTPGTYTLDYVINTSYVNNKTSRTVTVLENPFNYITFELKGDTNVQVDLGSTYEDLGYNLVSSKGGDFRNNVRIEGVVDTSKIGHYEISYTLTIGSKSKTIKRNVEVIGEHYSVKLDNESPTNQSVTVTVTSNLADFAYYLVSGEQVSQPSFTYTATKNGEYVFEMFKKDGSKEDIKVNISNIDKTPPTGTCSVSVNSGTKKSTFEISVKDDNKVSKVIYNNKEYSDNKFVVDGKLSKATITVYDSVSNSTTITCNITYSYIEPTGGTVVNQFSSNTLKYKILKKDNYYETHIWAKDPYNQMRTGLKFPFPQLSTVESLVPYVSKRLNFTGKQMIAFNASGFVSDQFSTQFISANRGWRNSSETAIVVHEGKVLRNFTNQVYPDKEVYTYGLKKDGYMAYYKISPGTKANMSNNQKLAQQLINDGVKYTYGFHPILTINGVKKTNDNAPNIRQGLCQIDKNNFVFLTNISSNRAIGLSFSKMADIFNSMGCIYGVNLDGGGSTSLYYKNRGTDKATAVRASSRADADMVYFVE